MKEKESCPWCGDEIEYKHYSLSEVYKKCKNSEGECTYNAKVEREDENN